MFDRLDAVLRFQQGALSLCTQRQKMLVANTANVDIPDYQVRDIDFASELRKAM